MFSLPPSLSLTSLVAAAIACLALQSLASAQQTVTVKPVFKAEGLIRNPGMGWVLYDDASGEVSDAREYWKAQDKVARDHASIFYVRWRWSDVEKSEGRYEWDDPNSNFSKLIAGARERGLRLAFRFYVNSTDNLRASTPDWVREACGDKNGRFIQDKWSPHLDNKVFQEKFANFVAAYGKRFNNPAEVEWIDVSSIGKWGEAHGLELGPGADKMAVYEWLLETYAGAFKKVLLGMQYGTEFGQDADNRLALDKYDCVLRRDGFGSQWIRGQIEPMKSRFPQNAIFAEKCYWNNNEAWRNDAQFKDQMKSWADVHRITLDQALECHANTLDLRTVWDAAEWMKTPELVARFENEGGYRITLVEAEYPPEIVRGKPWTVRQTWENHGVGVLPNKNQRWGNKYKVAFGLYDARRSSHVTTWIDGSSEPGDWIKGKPFSGDFTIPAAKTRALKPGNYQLVVAIVNMSGDGSPHLQLAMENKTTDKGASILGKILVR